MRAKSFFTRQRFGILGAGIVAFIVFLVLGHTFGSETETGVLFVDLAGSAVTIIATALIIELLQYIEHANRTHDVAAIAEAEIQAVCYRIKLAIVCLYGFAEDTMQRDRIENLKDAGEYLDKTSNHIDAFYDELDKNLPRKNMHAVDVFKRKISGSQHEIEQIIDLFDYALPFSLRTRILSLRALLQVSERILSYIDSTTLLTNENSSLIKDVTDSLYKSTKNVLEHGSRTEADKQLNTKPGRVGNDTPQ